MSETELRKELAAISTNVNNLSLQIGTFISQQEERCKNHTEVQQAIRLTLWGVDGDESRGGVQGATQDNRRKIGLLMWFNATLFVMALGWFGRMVIQLLSKT